MTQDSNRIQILVPRVAILEEILGKPVVVNDENDRAAYEKIIKEHLSEEEVELAACTSYAYWAWTKLQQSTSSSATSSTYRHAMAAKEVQRHYLGEDRVFDTAVEKLKSCLAWRKSEQVDLLRVCFHRKQLRTPTASSTTIDVVLTDAETERCTELEHLVSRDLAVQPMAVRGLDQEGRAMVIKLSRTQPWDAADTPIDGYYFAHFYVSERAMAVSEYASRGAVEHVTLMADFSTYESANSPPMKIVSGLVKQLQPVYPERLAKAFILEAPLWMQTMLTILRPFLAAKTRQKLVATGSMSNFVASLSGSSSSTKDSLIKGVVDPSQAMPFMMEDGELTDSIDTERQLEVVPFFEPYDHVPSTGE